MKFLITSVEESISKNNKPFIKAYAKSEKKEDITLYVWKRLDEFLKALESSRILEITANTADQFPEVSSFEITTGDPSMFVETAFVSDEYADELLTKILSFITEPEYVSLNERLFAKGSDIRKKFITFPAAKGHHHALRGGLLLHTYEVLQFVSMVANNPTYSENVDKQDLLEGALLHDIGKIKDYLFDGYAIEYSPNITLGSHLSTGCEFIVKYADNPDSPRMETVKHIIRSHHLLPEWGAVAKPATREAVLVFFGDYYSMIQAKSLSAEYDEHGIGKVGYDTFIDIKKAFGGVKDESAS